MGEEDRALLEVTNLTVHYGAVRALDRISLEVQEGEIVALIGPNGAGKSTTLKAICGIVKPTSGVIHFERESIKGIPPHDLVARGISLAPEERHVFTSMSVAENLDMGGYTLKSRREIKQRIKSVYSLFPVLEERHRQRAGSLSSGEQQMLAMGRALMLEPRLLLLDEPSFALSPNYVDIVFEKIQEINQNGTTVLLVEQNARMALECADRGYVFQIGEIFLEDKAKNLLENKEVRESFLGEE